MSKEAEIFMSDSIAIKKYRTRPPKVMIQCLGPSNKRHKVNNLGRLQLTQLYDWSQRPVKATPSVNFKFDMKCVLCNQMLDLDLIPKIYTSTVLFLGEVLNNK